MRHPPPTGKRGRPRVHGERFAFKEPDTWGEPDETLDLEDEHFGKVRLERWQELHEKKGSDVPYDVVRTSVHLERDKPPQALWLAWLAPPSIPYKPSGELTLLVGLWNLASTSAKKPWAGHCLVSRTKKPAIFGQK